jgi:hypothetical protein
MSRSPRTSRGDIHRHGDLEIAEDLPFQRREWLAERVAWAVMALLIAAALSGLFGTGPLSRTTAGDEAGPIWLEYERFARLLAPAPLRVHLGPGASREETVQVWIDRQYIDSLELQQVMPSPDSMEVGLERLIFTFRLAEGGGAAMITFNMRPIHVGSLSGQVGLINVPAVPVQQFIYP